MAEHASPQIVGLGEAMIRLSARDHVPLAAARDFRANVAGAELNTLVTAAQLGVRARWLTRLPANELGTMMRRHAQAYGIEVCAVEESEARAGVFFLESGTSPRPSRVLYDRRDSAASHLDVDDFDWTDMVRDARVAHLSGITMALGPGALAASSAFLGAARARGVLTSLDVNYRSRLWSEDDARQAMRQILGVVDVIFVSANDLGLLTGREGDVDDLARELVESFGVSTVVLRERIDIGDDELAVVVRVVGSEHVRGSASGRVVDQLGAGDAAAGAYLASTLRGDPLEESGRYGARAYARALTVPGDAFEGGWHDLDEGFETSRRLVR